MKKYIYGLIIAGTFAASQPAAAEISLNEKTVAVENVVIERSQSLLHCNFVISFANSKLTSNRELILTPYIVGEDGSEAALPTVIVAGRSRHIFLERHNTLPYSVKLYKYSAGLAIPYSMTLPYSKWMELSRLELREALAGCCSETIGDFTMLIDSIDFVERVFKATPAFIVPTGDGVKTRRLSGKAFVDFPVNKTEIYPDYRNNIAELAKIIASIDSVKNDSDITITSLAIKGFASPEGSYANNTRLAKGRTESLKEYVRKLYNFESDFIKTSFEPEDWEGLRNYVEASDIANRDAILAVIDSDLAPDPRDAQLRTKFPVQYAFLLRNVYPALRHSDYTIDYTIRAYTRPEEIINIMYTHPQNLTLGEFFLAARTLQPGSKEYNDLFETAVRMYPDSEVANLNAAASAIIRGDLVSAERYLEKAGDTPQAIYNRATVAALAKHYDEALQLFNQAARLKVAEAPAAIEQLKLIMKKQTSNK